MVTKEDLTSWTKEQKEFYLKGYFQAMVISMVDQTGLSESEVVSILKEINAEKAIK